MNGVKPTEIFRFKFSQIRIAMIAASKDRGGGYPAAIFVISSDTFYCLRFKVNK